MQRGIQAVDQPQQVDWWGLLMGLGVIGLLLSLILAGVFISQGNLSQHYQKAPVPMTASQLSKGGPPGDNWHVKVSGYKFDQTTTQSKGANIQKLECTIVPLEISTGDANALKLTNYLVNTEQEVYDFLQQTSFDCIAYPTKDAVISMEVKLIPTPEEAQRNSIVSGVFAAISIVLIALGAVMSKRRAT